MSAFVANCPAWRRQRRRLGTLIVRVFNLNCIAVIVKIRKVIIKSCDNRDIVTLIAPGGALGAPNVAEFTMILTPAVDGEGAAPRTIDGGAECKLPSAGTACANYELGCTLAMVAGSGFPPRHYSTHRHISIKSRVCSIEDVIERRQLESQSRRRRRSAGYRAISCHVCADGVKWCFVETLGWNRRVIREEAALALLADCFRLACLRSIDVAAAIFRISTLAAPRVFKFRP